MGLGRSQNGKESERKRTASRAKESRDRRPHWAKEQGLRLWDSRDSARGKLTGIKKSNLRSPALQNCNTLDNDAESEAEIYSKGAPLLLMPDARRRAEGTKGPRRHGYLVTHSHAQ